MMGTDGQLHRNGLLNLALDCLLKLFHYICHSDWSQISLFFILETFYNDCKGVEKGLMVSR